MPEIDLLHNTDTPEEGFGVHQAKVDRTIRLRTPESERGGRPSSSEHGTPTPSFFERLKRFFRGPAKPRIVTQHIQRPHAGGASVPSTPSAPVQPSSPHVMPAQPSKPGTADRVGAQPAWSGSLTGVHAGHAATSSLPQESAQTAPPRPVPPAAPTPAVKPREPIVPTPTLSPEIRPERMPHARRDHGAVTPRTPFWSGLFSRIRAKKASSATPPMPAAPPRSVPPPAVPTPARKPAEPIAPTPTLSPEIRPERMPHARRDRGAVTPRTPFWSGLFSRIHAKKASSATPPVPTTQPVPSKAPPLHPPTPPTPQPISPTAPPPPFTSSPASAPVRPRETPPPPPPTEEPGLSVNLIPEESIMQVTRPTRQLATVGIWALGAVLLSVLAIVGMTLYERTLSKQTAQIQEDIRAVETDIATFSKVRSNATTLAQRTDRIQTLLDRHVYWTQFFQKLEEHTVDEVSYGSFTGSLSGAFGLDATGADLASVTRQVYAFEAADNFISDVSVLSASLLGSSNDATSGAPTAPRASFTLDIIIQPDVLYRSATSTGDAAQR